MGWKKGRKEGEREERRLKGEKEGQDGKTTGK